MALIDREEIRRAIGRDNGWIIEGAELDLNGSASQIVDATVYSSARDQHVRLRSVVAITSGAERGERRLATAVPTPAGVITVSPDFSGAPAQPDTYEIWDPDGPHPDEVDRMIDRALAEDCWFWRPTPLTWLRDGDNEATLVVSSADLQDGDGVAVWEGSNVTPSTETIERPDEFIRQIRQILATSTPGYVDSEEINVDQTKRGRWQVRALVNAQRATETQTAQARIRFVDVTQGGTFEPQTTPLRHSSWGWGLLESAVDIPVGCHRFRLRLEAETNTDIVQWAWIQLWPEDAHTAILPSRVQSRRHVGPVFVRQSNEYGEFTRRPFRGRLERRDVAGRNVALELDPALAGDALWFYEKASYPALTSASPASTDDDNTTWAALPWVKASAEWEIFKFLKRRDRIEAPDRWDTLVRESEDTLRAMQLDYGIEPMFVEDSKVPSRRVVRPI